MNHKPNPMQVPIIVVAVTIGMFGTAAVLFAYGKLGPRW